MLGLGPFAERLERAAAEVAGVEHGVAVSSGTTALHLIVRSLGIGHGDEVVVPSFTFAASANAFLFEGATPVFADIEPDTYNLDPADLERRITDRTKAVMVVDVFGHPADWDAIERVADRHGLLLIDDSCEAIGATYRGRPVGSFGRAGAFAFYPNKQMTTGEGGMVVTDDAELAEHVPQPPEPGPGPHGHLARARAARLQLPPRRALGRARRVADRAARRPSSRSGSAWPRGTPSRLTELDWVRPPVVRPDVEMSWFVYVVTLDEGVDRDAVAASLAERGIPSRAYFPPLHLQPYIRERFGTTPGSLPVTEDIARRTLALPFHNNLSEPQVDAVIEALRSSAPSS